VPLNFGAALVPLRGILNTGVVMVVGMAGACIIRFGKVNGRVISHLCGDGAVVGMGRVSIGALRLSGEGLQVGFSEVRGDTVDGVSIETNGI